MATAVEENVGFKAKLEGSPVSTRALLYASTGVIILVGSLNLSHHLDTIRIRQPVSNAAAEDTRIVRLDYNEYAKPYPAIRSISASITELSLSKSQRFTLVSERKKFLMKGYRSSGALRIRDSADESSEISRLGHDKASRYIRQLKFGSESEAVPEDRYVASSKYNIAKSFAVNNEVISNKTLDRSDLQIISTNARSTEMTPSEIGYLIEGSSTKNLNLLGVNAEYISSISSDSKTTTNSKLNGPNEASVLVQEFVNTSYNSTSPAVENDLSFVEVPKYDSLYKPTVPEPDTLPLQSLSSSVAFVGSNPDLNTRNLGRATLATQKDRIASDSIVLQSGSEKAVSSSVNPQTAGLPRETWNGIEFEVSTHIYGAPGGKVSMLIPHARADYPDQIASDLSIRAFDLISLLRSRMSPSLFQRLASSANAQKYITLNELRLSGIAVSFDDHDNLVFKASH